MKITLRAQPQLAEASRGVGAERYVFCPRRPSRFYFLMIFQVFWFLFPIKNSFYTFNGSATLPQTFCTRKATPKPTAIPAMMPAKLVLSGVEVIPQALPA